MDTKEAINWIYDIWHDWENIFGYDAEQNLKEGKKLDEVIALLKRGEAYEKILKKKEENFTEKVIKENQ
jgi:hypothetical protein